MMLLVDLVRQRLRKEFAQFEIDQMCERYDDECGECITRKATEVGDETDRPHRANRDGDLPR